MLLPRAEQCGVEIDHAYVQAVPLNPPLPPDPAPAEPPLHLADTVPHVTNKVLEGPGSGEVAAANSTIPQKPSSNLTSVRDRREVPANATDRSCNKASTEKELRGSPDLGPVGKQGSITIVPASASYGLLGPIPKIENNRGVFMPAQCLAFRLGQSLQF